MARNGSRFPSPNSFFFSTPRVGAAICLSRLTLCIAADERAAVAKAAIKDAETLPFACECARWLSAGDGTREAVLAGEQEKQMQSALGQRIEIHLLARPEAIWMSEPENVGKYLSWWRQASGPHVVQTYVKHKLQAQPDSLFEFLKSCLPTAYGMSGTPIDAEFDRTTYDAIKTFVDPAKIATMLNDAYPGKLVSPFYHMPSEEPRNFRLANQFMSIHSKVSTGNVKSGTQETLAVEEP